MMGQLCILLTLVFAFTGHLAASTQEFSFGSGKKTMGPALEQALTTSAPAAPKIETEQKTEQKAEQKIYLNFDNASLSSVLNYLIDQKNLDVIPHKDLLNIKVSLLSREPMTINEAWETVLILMESNNFTIVNVNGVNRVIPLASAPQNALPSYSSARGIEPENLPDTNATCRYIYFCKNIKVAIAQTILTPLLSSDKSLQINNTLQACIITDNCSIIKSAMRIIKELDIGGMRQAIKILELKHTDADQLAKLFNDQIFQQQQQQDTKIRIMSEENKREMSFFAKDTKIFTDPSHNRMIFMGMEDSINKIIEFINKYLDVPLENAHSRLHVRELKYYDATNLKDLLDKMTAPPKGLGGQAGAIDGQYRFFEDVVITAEASNTTDPNRGAGNRLIISCNNEDWKRISSFIDQLDKPQPQIAIEMMIVDIQTDDTTGLGGQFRLKDGVLGKNIHASSFAMNPSQNVSMQTTNVLNYTGIDAHSSILSFGNAATNDVWALIRTLYEVNHTNIISQPYLIVNNNVKGVVKDTVTRRVAGQVQATNGSSIQNYEDVPAIISAEVTPHANAAGIIKLDIRITVNEFKATTGQSPDTTNREITTQASMSAGEVLVLGGLMSSKHSTSKWGVPFLSAIPILGTFFRDTLKENKKGNLYIFMRPTVIKPHFGLGADEYTQLKLDYAKYQVLTSDEATLSKDPIQRYLFSPSRYDLKQKVLDTKEGRMPLIDNFAERRYQPNEVEMSKDPSFKSSIVEADSISYEPEENFATMPHIDPDTYIAPGLMDDMFNDDFFKNFDPDDTMKPVVQKRKPVL